MRQCISCGEILSNNRFAFINSELCKSCESNGWIDKEVVIDYEDDFDE